MSSAVDSRVIMDVSGAEKLLGRGDMLFHANGANKPIRAQAAYVSDEEVERVMDFFSAHHTAPVEQYSEVSLDTIACAGENGPAQGNGKQEDELFPDAVKIVLESGQASISMIQRRLRVGYARAARLIDIMEQKKIVSGFDGSKPRKLLITAADYAEMFGGETHKPEEDME
ncbi:DNA translocase SpoIIIE [bioreactor metagenome]|uniref:DNA translocase SpoIIIE n=1 Tax=bioreactor metagenome TaxID=1076179 RepID=A0A645GED6_9ZZZZ